jgi:hypothetical protein
MSNYVVSRLLARCARAECQPAHYHQIAQAAAQLREWEEVAAQAEAHGLAPLVYLHLKGAGVQIPSGVKRELQGLYLRHRHANQVRTRVLHGVLTAYQAAGIPALVLKGAALSHMVYPQPGLRPMSDMDILVPESEAGRAQRTLAELGFDAPLPSGLVFSHRHLSTARLRTEGLSIEVEIHHQLFSDYFDNAIAYVHSMLLPVLAPIAARQTFGRRGVLPGRVLETGGAWGNSAPAGIEGLTVPPLPFDLAGQTAYTLGYEDMLWHLCRHLTSHVNAWESGRLIWVADIVSFAERFVAEIDWERIRRRYPAILHMLSLLHFMTPVSDELLREASIRIGHTPKGIGVDYQGWPRTRRADWRERGYRRVLCDTLCPSEWWLRLRYTLGSARPLFWYRWVRHPLYILGHGVRACLEWLGWPAPLELAAGPKPK